MKFWNIFFFSMMICCELLINASTQQQKTFTNPLLRSATLKKLMVGYDMLANTQ